MMPGSNNSKSYKIGRTQGLDNIHLPHFRLVRKGALRLLVGILGPPSCQEVEKAAIAEYKRGL